MLPHSNVYCRACFSGQMGSGPEQFGCYDIAPKVLRHSIEALSAARWGAGRCVSRRQKNMRAGASRGGSDGGTSARRHDTKPGHFSSIIPHRGIEIVLPPRLSPPALSGSLRAHTPPSLLHPTAKACRKCPRRKPTTVVRGFRFLPPSRHPRRAAAPCMSCKSVVGFASALSHPALARTSRAA